VTVVASAPVPVAVAGFLFFLHYPRLYVEPIPRG
jgi:hypothetical protein